MRIYQPGRPVLPLDSGVSFLVFIDEVNNDKISIKTSVLQDPESYGFAMIPQMLQLGSGH